MKSNIEPKMLSRGIRPRDRIRVFKIQDLINFFWQKSILPPPTITKVWFSSYNYKTGYFTSLNFSNRPFYLPRAVLKAVCYSNRSFVFFFFKKISIESLKNHSKSQKNHKIENPILLDSTWVDIRSEYIIWYTLVQFFYCNFRYILFYN